MGPVASQLLEEVTAHAQSDSLEDVREICADGTYFPNNLCKKRHNVLPLLSSSFRHMFSEHITTSQWEGPAIAEVSVANFVFSECANLESCGT